MTPTPFPTLTPTPVLDFAAAAVNPNLLMAVLLPLVLFFVFGCVALAAARLMHGWFSDD